MHSKSDEATLTGSRSARERARANRQGRLAGESVWVLTGEGERGPGTKSSLSIERAARSAPTRPHARLTPRPTLSRRRDQRCGSRLACAAAAAPPCPRPTPRSTPRPMPRSRRRPLRRRRVVVVVGVRLELADAAAKGLAAAPGALCALALVVVLPRRDAAARRRLQARGRRGGGTARRARELFLGLAYALDHLVAVARGELLRVHQVQGDIEKGIDRAQRHAALVAPDAVVDDRRAHAASMSALMFCMSRSSGEPSRAAYTSL